MTPGEHDARRDQAGVGVDDLDRLWAPWRAGYVAHGDGQDGCPFCRLPARGTARDRESLILHRGERCYVILNAYPYNPGHAMVVPDQHTDDLAGLDEPTASEMWDLGRRTVAVLRERMRCAGANLGMNLWRAGGAGIADHLHLHVVPRWGGDTNFMSAIGATRVLPAALTEVYDLLAPGFVRPGGAT